MLFVDLVYHHVVTEDSAGLPDVPGRGTFVSCEHPDLDACLHELLDAVFDVILEKVLNTCDALEFVVFFNGSDVIVVDISWQSS